MFYSEQIVTAMVVGCCGWLPGLCSDIKMYQLVDWCFLKASLKSSSISTMFLKAHKPNTGASQ